MPEMSRRRRTQRRNAAAVVVGGATLGAAFAAGAQWPVPVSAGSAAAALVFALAVLPRILRMDAAETKANAREEDLSRLSADFVLLGAAVASLVSIFYLVHQAGGQVGITKVLLIALAVAAVVLSWQTVQTVYTVHYGDLYYGDPIGGIDFNDKEPPDYH